VTGRLVEIKRFAVHDGPGIRTTLFLKGCSLACRWCHNPETLAPRPEIGWRERKCVQCGRCAEICPHGVHVFRDGVHLLHRERCTACGACVAACLFGALEYYGRLVTVDEAVDAVLEDRTFYAESGGGCTLSGGEPLLQSEFCAAVCAQLREHRVHCAVDTAGFVPWENFETVLPDVDLFLYDLKHADSGVHRAWTGAPNEGVIANLRRLAARGARIEVRVPLVPGLNDGVAELQAMRRLLDEIDGVDAVRVLPYHRLAAAKYEALGRVDALPDLPPPSRKALARARTILRAAGPG